MDANPDSVSTEKDPANDRESLNTELSRQKDLYLRLAADFDNFRRRGAQESERQAGAQKEAFIRELLPAIDNLERALASDPTNAEQLREGVQLTLQQLRQLLRRHGVEPEDSLGQPFDPHRQEAVMTRRDPSQPDHTVIETFQRGYRRGEEIFRPSKVVVNDLSRTNAAAAAHNEKH
jgi:molecular chaperone GrpE